MPRNRQFVSLALIVVASPAVAAAADPQAEVETVAEVSQRAPTPGSITYDEGLRITAPGGWFAARPGGRLQLRNANEAADGTPMSEVDIKRARLFVKGHLLSDAVRYKFQADFAERSYELKDLYMDFVLGDAVALRAGRFKRAFSRQQLTSSGNTELVDRAITDKQFAPGRDWGVSLHNFGEKSPEMEYSVGLYNGHGTDGYLRRDATADGGLSPAAVARIGYNHGGLEAYSEADLEGGGLRYGIGASAAADLEDAGTGWRGELDGIVKLRGLSASSAIYGLTGADGARAVGLHAQVGYVIGGLVQPALRYAHIARDGTNDDTREALGGLSLYLWKHRLKLQSEAGALIEQEAGNDSTEWIARTQLQVIL